MSDLQEFIFENGLTLFEALDRLGMVNVLNDVSRLNTELTTLTEQVYGLSLTVDNRINSINSSVISIRTDIASINTKLETVPTQDNFNQLSISVNNSIAALRRELDEAVAEMALYDLRINAANQTANYTLSLIPDINSNISANGRAITALESSVNSRIATINTTLSTVSSQFRSSTAMRQNRGYNFYYPAGDGVFYWYIQFNSPSDAFIRSSTYYSCNVFISANGNTATWNMRFTGSYEQVNQPTTLPSHYVFCGDCKVRREGYSGTITGYMDPRNQNL